MFSSYVASLDINLMRPSLFGWFVTLFHFVFWPLLFSHDLHTLLGIFVVGRMRVCFQRLAFILPLCSMFAASG
jgi:hypothetical protein